MADAPQIYKGKDIVEAIKAVYGLDPKTEAKPGQEDIIGGNYLGQQTVQTPDGSTMPIAQLMYIYRQGQGGGGPGGVGGAPGGGKAGAPGGISYLSAPAFGGTQGGIGSSGAMTTMANGNNPNIQQGNSQLLYMGGNPLNAAQTAQVMQLYQAYEAGDQSAGQQLVKWSAGMGLKPGELNAAVTNLRQSTGPNAAPTSTTAPETNALTQMAGIDPASEALRTAVANSYLTPLQQAQKPSAADYQTYLDQFKQLDPQEYAQRQGLGTAFESYLKQAQDEAALGSQLDPVTARQVEQQTRLGQAARGNVYGTPQMVQEAMQTGQAGMALKQQRQAALGTALGAQQGYLGSGLGLGSTAMSLYDRQQANLRAAQGGAMSYLGSGQTPYQAGASYLDRAEAAAANAAQGGPVYNPASLGTSYSGSASAAPQYGLDIGAQTTNWYNSLAATAGGMGAPTKNKGASAASGALSGAMGGATAGTAIYPGIGTAVGALAGAALGGASGYFS